MTVPAAEGRQLEAVASGPADGLTVVLQNGTPAGLMAAPGIPEAAAERGLRHVLYARPGHEGSTPDRQVSSAAADLAAVLDALGAGEYVTVGWSGGGPHALACAALSHGRCLAAASMAGVAPYHAEGLDWLAGMGGENVAEFQAAVAGPAELTSFLAPAAREMASVTGADVAAGMGDLVSAADKAAVTGEFADYLAAWFRAAVASGVAGWRDDDLAFALPGTDRVRGAGVHVPRRRACEHGRPGDGLQPRRSARWSRRHRNRLHLPDDPPGPGPGSGAATGSRRAPSGRPAPRPSRAPQARPSRMPAKRRDLRRRIWIRQLCPERLGRAAPVLSGPWSGRRRSPRRRSRP